MIKMINITIIIIIIIMHKYIFYFDLVSLKLKKSLKVALPRFQ